MWSWLKTLIGNLLKRSFNAVFLNKKMIVCIVVGECVHSYSDFFYDDISLIIWITLLEEGHFDKHDEYELNPV